MLTEQAMKRVHLGSVDLNLLVTLDALLREGSATKAARRLAKTQSAISHALARLRDAFGDPLFVRVGATLRPTPRAEALREPLSELLERAAGLLGAGDDFDPARLERTFSVGSNDLLENTAFPLLLDRLTAEAPKVSVIARPTGDEIERLLQTRFVDLAFVTRLHTEAGVIVEHLFDDQLELLLRKGHPALRRPIDLDAYCALHHVFVAPRGHAGGPVDDALEKRGRRRHVAFRTPSFTAALRVVAATDLVCALPSRYARTAPGVIVTRPLPLPEIKHAFRLAWSAALDADPGHLWFRGVFRRAVLQAYRVEGREPPASVA